MKKVFATHEIRKTVQTNNEPPFNSIKLKEFAAKVGFGQKNIALHHPKAQGQVEGFNKLVNKMAAIACTEGVDLKACRDPPPGNRNSTK